MTIRRRRFWIFSLAVLALMAGSAWLWITTYALSTKDVNRIKAGMAKDQVISELGRKPDWSPSPKLSSSPYNQWLVIDGIIMVEFDQMDRVMAGGVHVHKEGTLAWQARRLLSKFGR